MNKTGDISITTGTGDFNMIGGEIRTGDVVATVATYTFAATTKAGVYKEVEDFIKASPVTAEDKAEALALVETSKLASSPAKAIAYLKPLAALIDGGGALVAALVKVARLF